MTGGPAAFVLSRACNAADRVAHPERRGAGGSVSDNEILISIFGFAGRIAGDLLTSALGWVGSLLFGRVPRSDQIFVLLMMAGSFTWLSSSCSTQVVAAPDSATAGYGVGVSK